MKIRNGLEIPQSYCKNTPKNFGQILLKNDILKLSKLETDSEQKSYLCNFISNNKRYVEIRATNYVIIYINEYWYEEIVAVFENWTWTLIENWYWYIMLDWTNTLIDIFDFLWKRTNTIVFSEQDELNHPNEKTTINIEQIVNSEWFFQFDPINKKTVIDIPIQKNTFSELTANVNNIKNITFKNTNIWELSKWVIKSTNILGELTQDENENEESKNIITNYKIYSDICFNWSTSVIINTEKISKRDKYWTAKIEYKEGSEKYFLNRLFFITVTLSNQKDELWYRTISGMWVIKKEGITFSIKKQSWREEEKNVKIWYNSDDKTVTIQGYLQYNYNNWEVEQVVFTRLW